MLKCLSEWPNKIFFSNSKSMKKGVTQHQLNYKMLLEILNLPDYKINDKYISKSS
jgi:hypothetical protein